jgi:signal-transduction protein with cAMP-binding, CBS, and nucleotidyltransferase domain
MAQTNLDVRKREISALVDGVNTLELDLARHGIDATDEFDRMEAMDIINRIERRLLANMPDHPAHEAAE